MYAQPLPSGPNKRSSSAIAITPDGGMLTIANPDSNTLTLVNSVQLAPVVELAVGVDPRTVSVDDTGHRAYVANRGSDSMSVVDLTNSSLIAEIPVGNRPYGIIVDPSGDRVYISEQGQDQVRVLDTNSLTSLAVIPTHDRPSGMAISDDGRTLYVTHLLSPILSIITVSPDIFNQHVIIDLWPDSNLAQSVVLSPDRRYAFIPHTRSNTGNRALTFDTTVFPVVSLIDLASAQHLVGQQISLDTVDPPGVGLPFDAAITPDGGEIWVLNAASNDITVVDLKSGQRVAHIEVEDNPRGIVLSPDGKTAYVNNSLAGTVSVIDTTSYEVIGVISVTKIPLPPILLNGKRLFHSSDDPRVSRAQWISCNTCHFEAEHDGRTWSFGFAGPRNTTSLLGMIQSYPLRWSGEWDESADSEFAIRKENFGSGLIQNGMYCAVFPPDCTNQLPNQGRTYDLDCLSAFLDSLEIPLSPTHSHGEPMTDAKKQGKAIFNEPALGCIACHPPPLYTDHRKHDVGTVTSDERIGSAYDTPTLKGLYDSAPYFHDGSAATLYEALSRPSPGSEHDVRGLLTDRQLDELINFLLALPYE